MLNRIYLPQLLEYLNYFPCVALIGPRQCGKTTILNQLESKWSTYDLEKISEFDAIARNPDLFLKLNSEFIAFDEAQLLPELFPAIRVAIDQNRNIKGRFILTGSSSPDLIKKISESLAGRIAIIEMSPLSIQEVTKQSATPFFHKIIDKSEQINFLKNPSSCLREQTDINIIYDYWLRGGYPEPWVTNNKRFQDLWMNNYEKTYIERDILKLFPGINEQRYRMFLRTLANISGNIINYSELARSLGVSAPTIRDYFQIADKTFLWRFIPSFERNSTKRLVKHPRGYFRDSGLLNHLLHIKEQIDLLSHPRLGYLWEGLVIEEIIRGLNNTGVSFKYFHYRSSGGGEVDLVLEGNFGIIPVEIKYSPKVKKMKLKGIKNFIEEFECPFGIIINNDDAPSFYEKNLIGVPFNCI